jgi:hypothetical protein
VLKTGASATTAVTIDTSQNVTFVGSQTLSAGTANGVLYLNGSKVATSGSALTFDGTDFGVSGGNARINKNSNATILTLGGSPSANWEGDIQFVTSNTETNWRVASNRVTAGSFTITPSTAGGGSTFTTPAINLSSSGNLGLGVTPSAWGLGKAFQIAGSTGFLGFTGVNGNIVTNTYYDGSNYRYIANGAAFLTEQSGGHKWSIAPSGTAGNAITFTQAMTLDASGNLAVGTTTAGYTGANRNVMFVNGALSSLIGMAYGGTNGGYLYCDSGGIILWTEGSRTLNLGTASAGPIVFTTNNTERARIDSSGNLAVGASSVPRGRVYINSGASANTLAIQSNTTGSYLEFADVVTPSWANSPKVGGINNDLIFSTSGSERARIDSSGNLLVGTNTKLGGGLVGIDINNASPAGITLGVSGSPKGYFYSSPSVTRIIWETSSGYTAVVISGNAGGVSLANGGTAWAAVSDERLKDIIEPITDAAQKVSSLRAVIGKYKTDEEGTRRSFLIAQDVQAVLPEAIDEEQNEEKTLSLKYTEVIPLLVAAIQEQQALIETLTQRITALEGR